MKTDHEYQPEDIEALLAEKPFSQLYEEEKRFVLEHLASSEEYERMREMLLAIRGAAGEDDSTETFRPADRVKRELMEEFSREQRRRRALWWNSIGPWLRNSLRLDLPIVRISFAAVLVLLGVWTIFKITGNTKEETQLASQQPAPANKQNTIQPPAGNLITDNKIAATQPDTTKKTQPENVNSLQRGGVNYDAQTNNTNAQANTNSQNNNQVNQMVQQPVVPNNQQPQQGRMDSIAASNALANNVTFDAQYRSDSVLTITPANSNAVICSGSSISLTATGGSTYSWTPAANVTTNLTTGYTTTNGNVANGTYGVTVDPLNGVSKSRTLSADSKVISTFYELR